MKKAICATLATLLITTSLVACDDTNTEIVNDESSVLQTQEESKDLFEEINQELHYTDGLVYYLIGNEEKQSYLINGIGTVTDKNIVVPKEYNNLPIIGIASSGLQDCKAESIVLLDNIAKIGEFAFYDCVNLKNITITDGLKIIGEGAFQKCRSLISIKIPGSVTNIGKGAFAESGLTNAELSEGIEKLDSRIFYECYDLESIVIPQSIKNIEYGAFIGCINLRNITFKGTMEQWDAIEKDSAWNVGMSGYTVYCTDGDLSF